MSSRVKKSLGLGLYFIVTDAMLTSPPIVIALAAIFHSVSAKGEEQQLKSLSKLVSAQAARIQALEALVQSSGKRKGAPAPDKGFEAEPELLAFRMEERRRAAQKKQELLVPVFNVSVSSISSMLHAPAVAR